MLDWRYWLTCRLLIDRKNERASLAVRWGELTSHVQENESAAAKDREDGSSHEEESEPVEEDMGEVFVRETGCNKGPSIAF